MDRPVLRHTLDNVVALLELSREVGPAQDLDTWLRRIEEVTLRVIGCERVTVFVDDPARGQLRSRIATGEGELIIPAHLGIAGAAFQTRTIVNSPNVIRDERFHADIDARTGFRTRNLLAVPLIGYDKTPIGVLELINKSGRGFTRADEGLSAALASLAAVALQRQMLLDEQSAKRKLERDLDVARKIQRSLLPDEDPRITGFDIAGWSQPADAIGGDFYDYLTLESDRLGIVLADVTGHGLGSSLLACECRALVRAIASMKNDLETIVARANEILHRDLKSERFVTLFLGELDLLSGQLQYISAGHAPLFYCQARGDAWRRMDATMLALGIRSWVGPDPIHTLVMESGDILVLVTDGFDEWANPDDEPFGADRIFGVIRRYRHEPAAELISRLHSEVLAFASGAAQTDDLTAIVIKRLS
jgi:phosphoserine phosphatase RsbU/P